MSTLDEMEMPTLTFDPAPEPEEKAPVVPVQEERWFDPKGTRHAQERCPSGVWRAQTAETEQEWLRILGCRQGVFQIVPARQFPELGETE